MALPSFLFTSVENHHIPIPPPPHPSLENPPKTGKDNIKVKKM